MTEEVISGSTESNSQPTPVSVSAPEGQAQPTQNAESTEKLDQVIPKKYVTDIVRRERSDAYEKGKREALAELQKSNTANQSSDGSHTADASNSMGGMPSMSDDKVRQMIAEQFKQAEETRTVEAEQQKLYAAAAGIAQDFKGAMDQGKADYPDFEDKVKALDFASIAEIVQVVHETDKSLMQHAMYDLANNGAKIASLMILAHTQPGMVRQEVQSWLNSIRTNRQAAGQTMPKAPLSQVSPSTVGTADGGEKGVRDYRRANWARA